MTYPSVTFDDALCMPLFMLRAFGQDTFFVDMATYQYRSLEAVADSAANVVYKFLGAGIDGRAAALELMKLHEARPLKCRGNA